jgi:hypothetical protein
MKQSSKWEIDFSFFEIKGRKEFADKLKLNSKKSSKAIRLFFINLHSEAKETRDASKIIVKYVRNGKLSKQEEKELKLQVYDLLKIMGIGVPFVMIPGSTILIPFLMKIAEKRNINILPSSFSKDEITIDKIKDNLNEK